MQAGGSTLFSKKASFLFKDHGLPGQERTCAPRRMQEEASRLLCTFPHSTPATPPPPSLFSSRTGPHLCPKSTKHFPALQPLPVWSLNPESPSPRPSGLSSSASLSQTPRLTTIQAGPRYSLLAPPLPFSVSPQFVIAHLSAH